MIRNLILIRHGALEGQDQMRFFGKTDLPLSKEGRRQARALARRFSNSGKMTCWSSPMKRACETAQIAFRDLPLNFDQDLREIDFGRWEGLTFKEIERRDPARVKLWALHAKDFSFPGGESLSRFHKRMKIVMKRSLSLAAENLVFVTHGGVIRSLICLLLGLPERNYPVFTVEPGSVSIIRIAGGKAVLTGLNDTSHL